MGIISLLWGILLSESKQILSGCENKKTAPLLKALPGLGYVRSGTVLIREQKLHIAFVEMVTGGAWPVGAKFGLENA